MSDKCLSPQIRARWRQGDPQSSLTGKSGHLVMSGYSERCCAVDHTHSSLSGGQDVDGPRRQVPRYHGEDSPRLGQPLSVAVRVWVSRGAEAGRPRLTVGNVLMWQGSKL